MKLRANRRDLALADSHGQIWAQLAAAAAEDSSLFKGSGAEVQARLLDMLGLDSDGRFPMRRLITIWNHERWREMTTRWCKTAVGRATFAISSWEWMVSSRIDDVS
jgi:hypothetical protein